MFQAVQSQLSCTASDWHVARQVAAAHPPAQLSAPEEQTDRLPSAALSPAGDNA